MLFAAARFYFKQRREAKLSFPLSNRVIDRGLSAMNGCKGIGGEKP